MKKIETVKTTKDYVKALICDVCEKEYSNSGDDLFEFQEFVNIDFVGGYGSIFGDGDKFELNICQHCFKEKLGKYIRSV